MFLLNDVECYPLVVRNGHLLIDIDGACVLIDTGSPVSLGRDDRFRFLGKDRPLQSDLAGMHFDTTVELLGFNVDVLIGMDILANMHVVIRLGARTIGFHASPPAFDGASLALESRLPVPIIPVDIDGRRCRAFLDTGAALCYFDRDVVGRYAIEREVTDFYPGYDSFETPVRVVTMTVGGYSKKLATGSLPDALQACLLAASGVDGIVGTPLLEHCDVCLSFPEGLMRMQ